MIVTESRPLQELKGELKRGEPISIVSCNVCAAICKTSGAKKVEKLRLQLTQMGYSVLEDIQFVPACSRNLSERIDVPKGKTVLVLACDAGLVNVQKHCIGKHVVSGTNTIGLGTFNNCGEICIIREFK